MFLFDAIPRVLFTTCQSAAILKIIVPFMVGSPRPSHRAFAGVGLDRIKVQGR